MVGRVALIGPSLRIYGYGLAGALVLPAHDKPTALRQWRELASDIAVLVLTPEAAAWINDDLAGRPDVMTIVLPDSDASGETGTGLEAAG